MSKKEKIHEWLGKFIKYFFVFNVFLFSALYFIEYYTGWH